MTGAAFTVRTIELDLPAFAGALNRRLREAGLPTTVERATRFAHALKLVRPVSRRRLYWTARAVFVTDQSQMRTFDSVFWSLFGGRDLPPDIPEAETSQDRDPT
jgi:uncharacterized protein